MHAVEVAIRKLEEDAQSFMKALRDGDHKKLFLFDVRMSAFAEIIGGSEVPDEMILPTVHRLAKMKSWLKRKAYERKIRPLVRRLDNIHSDRLKKKGVPATEHATA